MLPPAAHYELAKQLAPLRDEGVLIVGSGNLVHNLHAYAWGGHPAQQFDWALRFELRARELMNAGEHEPLIDYESLGNDALLSVPTPEHYLPLLYVLATQQPTDTVSYPVEGGDGGSISMLSVRVGQSCTTGKETFTLSRRIPSRLRPLREGQDLGYGVLRRALMRVALRCGL